MRVVVTGATGNVGTSVLAALGRDPAVSSIVGVSRRRPQLKLDGVEWVSADVVSSELDPVFRGADAVVHLAWLIQPSRDRETLRAVNVTGTRRVLEAAAAAGVGALVYASSVGAYSPGPKDRAVDESWPTEGVASSYYAQDKAATERLLDELEREQPGMRVVRLRPGLIFKRGAASEIRRFFIGPLAPRFALGPERIPLVPRVERLRFQAVHTDDVAEAYRLAVTGDARGAFNIAADPVLDPDVLAETLGARQIRVPAPLLRTAAAASWRLRLQPTPEGWIDLALGVPIMDTTRARDVLGWEPRMESTTALRELLGGLRDGAGFSTPPLAAQAGGRFRLRELATGIGARSR